MSLSIRTNISSLNAQRNLSANQVGLDSSLSRLSSGFRITKAGDDAAGLGISTKLESQIRSYNQAVRNANDGISVVQSTEAALNEQANILTRMRELAMQSASDGVGNVERGYIEKESSKLLAELQRISQVAEYNGTKLLDGAAATLDFQVGIAATANDVISLTTLNATTAGPSGVGATGPATLGATAAAVDPLTATAHADLLVLMNAGSTLASAQIMVQSNLELAGASIPVAFRLSDAARRTFSVAFSTAGGGAGNEAIVGAPTAAQQAGLDLVSATASGGAGSGIGSAELAAAYSAYGNALVSSGGSRAAALAAVPTATTGAIYAKAVVEYLFDGTYAAANGNTLPPATVSLGSAQTAAALAALGFAVTPGAPGAPANPGGLNLSGLSLATKGAALSSLASIDAALGTISSNRATLGAAGNRFQSAISNIQAFSESLSAANSRIKDVDVAEETSRMSRSQILLQAGVSVLAQANQMPQMALKLLG